MSMEEVQMVLSQAGDQLQQAQGGARKARRMVHRARTVVDSAAEGVHKTGVWLLAVGTVQQYVGTIIDTGMRKLTDASEDFRAVAGDSQNPAAQNVYQQAATAHRQLDGHIAIGDISIPLVLSAIEDDMQFIVGHLEFIRGLGSEMLDALGVADQILEMVETSEQQAADSTQAYMYEIG